MIDFHTHILPGIDDGSRSVEMTMQMLNAETEQGVTGIVATPHFYAHKSNIEDFLAAREESFASVQREIAGSDEDLIYPEIFKAAEVYWFSGMGKAKKLPELCIEGTSTLLLEMPFRQWDEEMLQEVKLIMTGQKLHVVLAHVERYMRWQKDKAVWKRLLEMPLTLQVNAESLKGGWLQRRFCFKLIKERQAVLIGSDCHDTVKRPPNLLQARTLITKKLGAAVLRKIDEEGRKRLQTQL